MSEKIQYVVDSEGKRVAAILPIEEFEELMEDLHLLRIAVESRGEERIPWEQVKKELIEEGKLEREDLQSPTDPPRA